MPRYGGAVIPMPQNSSDTLPVPAGIRCLVGDAVALAALPDVPARPPFDGLVLDFLNEVSRALLADPAAKRAPDVVTFAFWIRKASTAQLKARFHRADGNIRLGRGVAFHIAPSNVAVNYAYSLVAGLFTGNANVVRVPTREFEQVNIIDHALTATLAKPEYAALRPYICLVRYERSREINDWFSAMADTRIVWGGDATVAELRQSPLAPRATEITFADRWSLAVIDAQAYLQTENKKRVAENFYNDTYLTDQNACTSPRLVVWTGAQKEQAKALFWQNLYALVRQRYPFQAIQGVNKLTSAYRLAAAMEGAQVLPHEDNLLVRVQIPALTADTMEYKDNSGYFLEYNAADILELKPLCSDVRCQTIGFLADPEMLRPLLLSGIKGVDRVVPLGKTMDFDLIWDGYDLYSRLTRVISVPGQVMAEEQDAAGVHAG